MACDPLALKAGRGLAFCTSVGEAMQSGHDTSVGKAQSQV